MLDEIVITSIEGSGYSYQPVRQAGEVGKLPSYEEEERIARRLKRESKKIAPSSNSNGIQSRYNSNGEIVPEEDSGRHLDFTI
ncbi:MAG: hypothetical protein AABW47_04180 [Nanoarchaeota archaeon]